MHRRGHSYADDSESLQADVMRFMAIIAFCLIAILALVKHAEPPETTREVEPTPAPPVTSQETQPDPQPEPAEPEPIQTDWEGWEELRLAAAEMPDPRPQPEPVVEPEPAIEVPEPVVEAPNAPEPPPLAVVEPERPAYPDFEPAPMEEPAAEPTPEAAPSSPAEPEDEGLTLRFASDGDFLRLIAKGDIQVYAFHDSDVLTLSESYRFLDTQSPGQVYELLPPSIPSLIVDALKQARTDIGGYRWGIALPGHISNQIERHLGQVTRGQLVIDRYGDVHHVAAS
ncbi:MAG: hypothetical protein EP301_12980 [Gammaproteobacteria bacterium]|jgi:hypothetical protein|nr:MAG: hypothetical protein EP301_12980 [Gammaproteobacteria bacterium]